MDCASNLVNRCLAKNMDDIDLVNNSINQLIERGFLHNIPNKRNVALYQVFDLKEKIADIIVERIRTSNMPQTY